jgi:nucleotide-binding universal stress UspA family protein
VGKILCATRGGEASYRTQDAVIELAREQGDTVVFLYVVDTQFLGFTARAVRPDVVAREMENMGEFLLIMASERASRRGVEASYQVRHGPLPAALLETAVEEEVSLVALGSPTGEQSRFQLDDLEELGSQITEQTGIPARII